MFNVPGFLALAWCLLGYLFLGRGEATGAIVSSMGSISMAWFAYHPGSSSIPRLPASDRLFGPVDRWFAARH